MTITYLERSPLKLSIDPADARLGATEGGTGGMDDRQSSKIHGFTLLELIIVLTVLAVVTSIATVNSAAVLGQIRASGDIQELATRIHSLRALLLRATIAVTFTPDGFYQHSRILCDITLQRICMRF